MDFWGLVDRLESERQAACRARELRRARRQAWLEENKARCKQIYPSTGRRLMRLRDSYSIKELSELTGVTTRDIIAYFTVQDEKKEK